MTGIMPSPASSAGIHDETSQKYCHKIRLQRQHLTYIG